MKNTLFKVYFSCLRFIQSSRLKIYIKSSPEVNIIIGAADTKLKNWVSTNKYFFNLIDENDYRKFFSHKKIDMVLIEHVLEHLDNKELDLAIKLLYEYSSSSINIRVAVPDGFHNCPKYIEYVKPGGTGSGAEDHKILFNYKSLTDSFAKFGFKFTILEYWDENGNFTSSYNNDSFGSVSRSFLNDERNKDAKPNYTSLIVDFIKS